MCGAGVVISHYRGRDARPQEYHGAYRHRRGEPALLDAPHRLHRVPRAVAGRRVTGESLQRAPGRAGDLVVFRDERVVRAHGVVEVVVVAGADVVVGAEGSTVMFTESDSTAWVGMMSAGSGWNARPTQQMSELVENSRPCS